LKDAAVPRPNLAPAPEIGIPAHPHVARTVCAYCGVGCGMRLEVRGGTIRKTQGDSQHPANWGRLCPKGGTLAQVLHAPGRALHPLMRPHRGAPHTQVSWDTALDHVAYRLRAIVDSYGPDAVAIYGSGQLLTEDYYVANKLMKGFLGTNNLDTNSRLCMASAVAGYRGAFGQDGPPCTYEDVDAADAFLIVGANVADCHPVLFARIRARKAAAQGRVQLIVVDPRATETAALADQHLAIEPGSDVALLRAMLHVLIVEGLVADEFVGAQTSGWAETRALALAWPPERAAAVCGVEAAAIRTAARAYGHAGAALTLWSMGVNQSTRGVDKTRALIDLSLATGNVGRPGAGPFSLTGPPNAMGGREVGGLSHLLPGYRDVTNATHRAEVAALWGVPAERLSPRPGLSCLDLFEALDAGDVKAVWIAATNPLVSVPDLARNARALERAELVIVQDPYHPTETSQYADVVLPTAQWAERTGTMTNSERRVSLLEQAVAPPGEARPDWAIFADVGRRLGYAAAFAFPTAEAVFEEYKWCTRGRPTDLGGVSYARLRFQGSLQWPCPAPDHPGTPRLYTDGAFATPDGRARFSAVDYAPPAEPPDAAFPFVLTTGRVRDQWHTMTRTGKVPVLLRTCPLPFVELNADDAARLGIAVGDVVEVRSRRGVLAAPARLAAHLRPGTVFVPMHWGALQGEQAAPVNALLHTARDPESHQPELKHCAVALRRVGVLRQEQGASA
jgi:ferredoxin-nitrate reductase